MSIKIVKNYVNGQWREAENTGYLDVENPSTGEILACRVDRFETV